MMSLSEKIVANIQKRNLKQMQEQLKERKLDDAVVRPIYYPESSDLLRTVLKNISDDLWQKKSYMSRFADCENQLTTLLATLSSQEKTVLCFFPDYSPRTDAVISDLPILEVSGNTIDEWYKLAKDIGLQFFLCSSTDLRKGVALDVYEADPVVHQTAGAVMDLHYWNV